MKARFMFRKSALIAVSFALIFVTVAFAASGALDTSFSGDGKLIQSFGGTQHIGRAVAVRADGKIIAVGEKITATGRDFAIARYNVNGSLDTTFSGDGKLTVNFYMNDQATSVVLQTDGKIIVAGQACNGSFICDVALVRLNPNGTLDTTFSGDGKVLTNYLAKDNGGSKVIMQGTKILVAGYSYDGTDYNATLYRYNPNGTLDTTFSGDGIRPIDLGKDEIFRGIAVYSGKIYAVGESQQTGTTSSAFIIAKINNNGSSDTTFGGVGYIISNFGTNRSGRDVILSAGYPIVVGVAEGSIFLVKFTPVGSLDTTFGAGTGQVVTTLGLPAPVVWDGVLQGGKIVLAGATGDGDAMLVRFTADGTLDTTFDGDGIVETDWGGGTDVYGAVVYRNSRLHVVGGSKSATNIFRFIVAAYLP
jgi:uncharacterized delta-60 repeat protein